MNCGLLNKSVEICVCRLSFSISTWHKIVSAGKCLAFSALPGCTFYFFVVSLCCSGCNRMSAGIFRCNMASHPAYHVRAYLKKYCKRIFYVLVFIVTLACTLTHTLFILITFIVQFSTSSSINIHSNPEQTAYLISICTCTTLQNNLFPAAEIFIRKPQHTYRKFVLS